jgi:hypothetical protein
VRDDPLSGLDGGRRVAAGAARTCRAGGAVVVVVGALAVVVVVAGALVVVGAAVVVGATVVVAALLDEADESHGMMLPTTSKHTGAAWAGRADATAMANVASAANTTAITLRARALAAREDHRYGRCIARPYGSRSTGSGA